MKKIFILFLTLVIEINSNAQVSVEASITYFGHSCFQIITSNGTRIITDPVEFKAYHLPKGITADIVTVSHNHVDHNRVDAISGNPEVLKGTTSNIQEVIPIDKKINEVRIYTVPSYHNPGKHGMNAIFVFEFDGIKMVHLGDLGTTLSEEQIKAIGEVDIMLIPVGGKHTISKEEADRVVDQLKVRRAVLPMHFKTEAFADLPYSVDDYLRGKINVKRISGNRFVFNLEELPLKREYIILDYK
ncbi:MAG: MBL fold metallo-hydrolase [Bacteroidetes bacterium]|nr:MBL fold metallo-hydrolase [Bacteroidota bacterium]